MQPVLTVLKGSDARRRYKPPARPYHLFYYTGFVNTFTENGRTFYPYPPLRGSSFHRKEGASTQAPSLGRGEGRSEAGLASFFAAKPPSLSLPQWGRGTASAVDRVLSLMAHLRRSPPLSFIPLVPYPARSACHLPHAGKALFRKYRYPHPTSAPSGHLLPREGGRMPASLIANPFPASSSRNLPLFCGTI